MAGFYYVNTGTRAPAQPDDGMARLRAAQMRDALDLVVRLGPGARPRARKVSGDVLDASDAGGDDARVIDADEDVSERV